MLTEAAARGSPWPLGRSGRWRVRSLVVLARMRCTSCKSPEADAVRSASPSSASSSCARSSTRSLSFRASSSVLRSLARCCRIAALLMNTYPCLRGALFASRFAAANFACMASFRLSSARSAFSSSMKSREPPPSASHASKRASNSAFSPSTPRALRPFRNSARLTSPFRSVSHSLTRSLSRAP